MKTFLNLTNGIEALNWIPDAEFVRIQSTACEQKRWNDLVRDLDYNFLLAVAREPVKVIDFSQKPRAPRALWQGIPLIEMLCNSVWYGHARCESIKITERGGYAMEQYFLSLLGWLYHANRSKFDHIKKFTHYERGKVEIVPYWYQTSHDSDYNYYRNILDNAIRI